MSRATGDHPLDQQPCENQWCAEVDLDRAIDLVGFVLEQRPGCRKGRIENGEVDLAGSVDEVENGRPVLEIAGDHLGGEIGGEIGNLFGPPCREDERPRPAGELASQRTAKAARCPGQEDSSVERIHVDRVTGSGWAGGWPAACP